MNERLAAGYDVLVWIDSDGDVVCQSYTAEGRDYLRTILADYEPDTLLVVETYPEEFRANAPAHLRIGMVQYGTTIVVPLERSRLH